MDIEKLAREAGFAEDNALWTTLTEVDWATRNPGRAGSFYVSKEGPADIQLHVVAKNRLRRFAALVAEECAKICDVYGEGGIDGWKHNTPQDAAAAIRERFKAS